MFKDSKPPKHTKIGKMKTTKGYSGNWKFSGTMPSREWGKMGHEMRCGNHSGGGQGKKTYSGEND